MRTSNVQSHILIEVQELFKANNIFSENYSDRFYVVYSYGYHFPLWVYDCQERQWYENSSKYSVTTSKHKSQSRPRGVENFICLPTAELKNFFYNAEREAKALIP